MSVLKAEEVVRIYRVTDRLGLHRMWVVVPLRRSPAERVIVEPDGKLFVEVPEGAPFDEWLAGFEAKLEKMDLARVPRGEEPQPSFARLDPENPPGSTLRQYLQRDDLKRPRVR